MEPASSAEFLLRTYEAFLLYLAILFAAFAAGSVLTYLAFLCEECFFPLRTLHLHVAGRHSLRAFHHSP